MCITLQCIITLVARTVAPFTPYLYVEFTTAEIFINIATVIRCVEQQNFVYSSNFAIRDELFAPPCHSTVLPGYNDLR